MIPRRDRRPEPAGTVTPMPGPQLELSFPKRRYDLAAPLLAEAMGGDGGATTGGLDAVARRFGEELGREARRRLGRRPAVDQLLAEVVTVLERYGFEPVCHDG